jgi:hypothetical protein
VAAQPGKHKLPERLELPRFRLRRPSNARQSVGTVLAIVCFLAVVALEIVRRAAGFPTTHDFAASPAAVASAKVWLLVTSAFIVNGPAVLELTGVAVAVALLIRIHGANTFWVVAAVGHFGSTLAAYAGVGLLWLVTPDAVEDVVERPDYGISGAWLAVLGALCASSWRTLAAGRGGIGEAVILIVSLTAGVIGFSFFPLLAGVEHVLAFLFGAGVLLAYPRSRLLGTPIRRTASQAAE